MWKASWKGNVLAADDGVRKSSFHQRPWILFEMTSSTQMHKSLVKVSPASTQHQFNYDESWMAKNDAIEHELYTVPKRTLACSGGKLEYT